MNGLQILVAVVSLVVILVAVVSLVVILAPFALGIWMLRQDIRDHYVTPFPFVMLGLGVVAVIWIGGLGWQLIQQLGAA